MKKALGFFSGMANHACIGDRATNCGNTQTAMCSSANAGDGIASTTHNQSMSLDQRSLPCGAP